MNQIRIENFLYPYVRFFNAAPDLENADFYGRNKKEYWAHKSGHLTHRDMLKRDLDFAIENCEVK